MLDITKLNTSFNTNPNLSFKRKQTTPFAKESNDTFNFKEKPSSISDDRQERKIKWLQVTVGAAAGIIAGALLFRNKNGEKIQNLAKGVKESSDTLLKHLDKADNKTLPLLDKFIAPMVKLIADKEPDIALKIQKFRIEKGLAKIEELTEKKSNIFDLCKKSEMDKPAAEQFFTTIKTKFPNEEQKLKELFDKVYK